MILVNILVNSNLQNMTLLKLKIKNHILPWHQEESKKKAEAEFFTPDSVLGNAPLRMGKGVIYAQKQYEELTAGLDRAFAIEFQQFLQGNSRWNIMKRGDGVTPVVPWGIRSLWHIDGVTPYLNSFLDKRMEYQKKLAHLYLRGPTTLNEAYLYFKFIVCDGVLDEDEAAIGFLNAYNADFPMTQEFRDVQADMEINPYLPIIIQRNHCSSPRRKANHPLFIQSL